jgi:hypothetical protein
MIWFTIKKTFFDMWDHLLSIALLNIGGTLLIGVVLYALQNLAANQFLFFLGIALAMVTFSVYIAVVAGMMKDIADYHSPEFKDVIRYLKTEWRAGCAFSGWMFMQLLVILVVIPWYFHRNSFLGFGISAFLFWGSVMWLLASQYYFPARHRLNARLLKIPQKCVLLFFDNTAFTIVLGIGTLFLSLVSGLTVFMFPGVSTILLWHHVALKLRLYKYNYLEEHPNNKKQRIPWDELLQDDRDRVGTRTLKEMVFPWKS